MSTEGIALVVAFSIALVSVAAALFCWANWNLARKLDRALDQYEDHLRDCLCKCKKMGCTESGEDKSVEPLCRALEKNAEVLGQLANRSMNAALIEGRLQLQRITREEQTNEAVGSEGAPEHPMGLSPGFSAPPREGTLGGRPNMMP